MGSLLWPLPRLMTKMLPGKPGLFQGFVRAGICLEEFTKIWLLKQVVPADIDGLTSVLHEDRALSEDCCGLKLSNCNFQIEIFKLRF